MTNKEQTQACKKGCADGYKSARNQVIEMVATGMTSMPDILPEKYFKDRASTTPPTQTPETVCPTCGSLISGEPVCQDFREATRNNCWFLEKTVEGYREERAKKHANPNS